MRTRNTVTRLVTDMGDNDKEDSDKTSDTDMVTMTRTIVIRLVTQTWVTMTKKIVTRLVTQT